jgi:large subunit ribosomal protein L20
MSRVKRGLSHLKKRRNLLKRVKGFEGGQKNLIKRAKTAELKAGAHAYRDRRVKKRNFRALWQIRINAAAREHGMSYSVFMNALKKKGIKLDRKVLSEIAAKHPHIFASIVTAVK